MSVDAAFQLGCVQRSVNCVELLACCFGQLTAVEQALIGCFRRFVDPVYFALHTSLLGELGCRLEEILVHRKVFVNVVQQVELRVSIEASIPDDFADMEKIIQGSVRDSV